MNISPFPRFVCAAGSFQGAWYGYQKWRGVFAVFGGVRCLICENLAQNSTTRTLLTTSLYATYEEPEKALLSKARFSELPELKDSSRYFIVSKNATWK